MFQTWGKKTTPKKYRKLEFQTLKAPLLLNPANIRHSSTFFEPSFCSQPIQYGFLYIFEISDKQSFISKILTVVGPLGGKFKFLIPLGIH